MISIRRLHKKFGVANAVEDLSLEIQAGEVVGLLGPNGAGKTTTVRMLACLIAPTSGEATVCGFHVGRQDTEIRRCIGILTETPGLYNSLSARRNLDFFAQLHGVVDRNPRVQKYLEILDLAHRQDEPVGNFSKGMKQKLAIARALVHEPQVLFLDEPTSGLDPEMSRTVRQFIAQLKSEGRTIILCTHNLYEAELLCDRIAVVRTRLLAFDRPSTLRANLYPGATIVRLRTVEHHILEAVKSLAFVSAVESVDGSLRMHVQSPEENHPILVRKLVEAGAEMIELSLSEPSLEDIYLNLMHSRSVP